MQLPVRVVRSATTLRAAQLEARERHLSPARAEEGAVAVVARVGSGRVHLGAEPRGAWDRVVPAVPVLAKGGLVAPVRREHRVLAGSPERVP